jgi:hypothetical protein
VHHVHRQEGLHVPQHAAVQHVHVGK